MMFSGLSRLGVQKAFRFRQLWELYGMELHFVRVQGIAAVLPEVEAGAEHCLLKIFFRSFRAEMVLLLDISQDGLCGDA